MKDTALNKWKRHLAIKRESVKYCLTGTGSTERPGGLTTVPVSFQGKVTDRTPDQIYGRYK